MPTFNGGRKSKFTDDQREKFIERIKEDTNVTITDARKILYDEFGHEYSLVHVSELLSKLGFHYNKSRPKFREAPDNGEEILINNLDEANITSEDKVIIGKR